MGTVLVTGASDGIGHATAKALLQRGDTVLAHGRTEPKAAAAAKALGKGASAVWAELGDFRQIRVLAAQLEEALWELSDKPTG